MLDITIENINNMKDYWWIEPLALKYLPESEKWTKEELISRLKLDEKVKYSEITFKFIDIYESEKKNQKRKYDQILSYLNGKFKENELIEIGNNDFGQEFSTKGTKREKIKIIIDLYEKESNKSNLL